MLGVLDNIFILNNKFCKLKNVQILIRPRGNGAIYDSELYVPK
jgi:hypothetical protein